MKNPSSSNPKVRPAGFPFLLIIVYAVIFLGACVPPWRHGMHEKFPATESKIFQLCAAVQSYQTNGGMVPSAEQGLKALVEKPQGRPVPVRWVKLASERDLLDAWRVPFAYYSPARKGGGDFEIVSAGPDKTMHTGDDISSVMDGE